MWYSGKYNNLQVSSGQLHSEIEQEFGSYRLHQLVDPLKALKVCTLSKAKNYWVFSNIANGYNNNDIQIMIADIKKGLYSSGPASDFAQDLKDFLNKIWGFLPKWFRWVVLLIIAASSVWGVIKVFPDAIERTKVEQAKQSETHFVAQQIWTEVQSNLKTLNRFLTGKKKKPMRFIYDSYAKYSGQLGKETSQQTDNFYKNLKRIENGEPYTDAEINKVQGQGMDVLNFLKRDFGLRDYFESSQGVRIASAYGTSVLRPSKNSGIVSADAAVVSADLPDLAQPPYGAVGEDVSKGNDGKSN
jgi:hypothetical protein